MSVIVRRTPALTREVRDRFEELLQYEGFMPGRTISRIARETGLTSDQVRDSIFGESADEWRHGLRDRALRWRLSWDH